LIEFGGTWEMGDGRGFQCTKECVVWMLYTKVMNIQSFIHELIIEAWVPMYPRMPGLRIVCKSYEYSKLYSWIVYLGLLSGNDVEGRN